MICDYVKLSFYICRRIAVLFCKLSCLKTVVHSYSFTDDFQETKIARLTLLRRAMYRLPAKMLAARPAVRGGVFDKNALCFVVELLWYLSQLNLNFNMHFYICHFLSILIKIHIFHFLACLIINHQSYLKPPKRWFTEIIDFA